MRHLISLAALCAAAGGSVASATVDEFRVSAASQEAGGELRAAASRGDLAAVEGELERGIPVDAANEYGATSLILAAMNGHAEVAQALLAAGADPRLADTFYDRTPMEWARLGGSERVTSILFVAGAGDFDELFLEAVAAGDVDQVSQLLSIEMPADEVLSQALDEAVGAGNDALAQLLMGHGAELPMPAVISVDAATLRMYEGRYIDEVGYELVIVADQQTRTLLVRPPGARNPLRFVPVEQTTFIVEDTPNVSLRFTVRDGRTVSLMFIQSGESRRMAPR